METTKPAERWRVTRSAGMRRTASILIGSGLLALALILTLSADRDLLMSPVGFGVHAALIGLSVYNLVAVFVHRVEWSDTGIRQVTPLGTGPLNQWDDLTDLQRLTSKRATVLKFGALRRVKIMWSFDAHGEIVDLAENQLMQNARTS